MWFKTRTGLIGIEGTAEFLAERYSRPGIGKLVGVYGYQVRHFDVKVKRLFQKPVEIHNRKLYLARIPDDESAVGAVADCMARIERAIRGGEPICDLSDVGTDAAWDPPKHGVMVPWNSRGT